MDIKERERKTYTKYRKENTVPSNQMEFRKEKRISFPLSFFEFGWIILMVFSVQSCSPLFLSLSIQTPLHILFLLLLLPLLFQPNLKSSSEKWNDFFPDMRWETMVCGEGGGRCAETLRREGRRERWWLWE
jgi:hypothetical protein